MRITRLAVAAALVAALAIGGFPAGPAGATYPGANGKIAFTSMVGNKPQIFVMNHTGSNKTQLTERPRRNFSPSFFSDGQKMVFSRIPPSGVTQIYSMSKDGTLLTQITTGNRSFQFPAISPDNSTIVASSEANNGFLNLFLMDADGTNIRRFTQKKADDVDASFSSDGQWVLFERNLTDGSARIVKRRVDGSDQMFLTGPNATNLTPSFSPDDSMVAYTHVHGAKQIGRIYTMNADGTGKTRVTDNGKNVFFTNAVFSPDGLKLACLRFKSDSTQPADIYTMNTDGSNRERLTDQNFFVLDLDWGVA
jgi:TolB protein